MADQSHSQLVIPVFILLFGDLQPRETDSRVVLIIMLLSSGWTWFLSRLSSTLYKVLAPPSTGYWEPAFMNPKRLRGHVRLASLEDREVKAEPNLIPSPRVLEQSPSPNNGLVFMSATGVYVLLLSVIGAIAILG